MTEQRNLFRVHGSGGFFSPWYMRAVFRVVGARPWIEAYGYTKRSDLLKAGLWDMLPPNYSLLQSVGGKFDDKIDETRPHSKVFLTEEDRDEAGYIDGNDSDIPAIDGRSVGLVYHGSEGVKSVDTTAPIKGRGGFKAVGPGQWEITVPTGLKNRRLHVHTFDFRAVEDGDLPALIKVKTGNQKIKKTAKKLSKRDGVKYYPLAIDLPALASCPGAATCALFCYAMQGAFQYPVVREAQARTWAVLLEAHRRGGEDMVVLILGQALDAAAPRSIKRQMQEEN